MVNSLPRLNDWIGCGIDHWSRVRFADQKFQFQTQSKTDRLLDFADACAITAEQIYHQQINQPLYVSLSGGVDSELVANTLWHLKIPFVPVIASIADINQEEKWYAEYWCHTREIVPMRITIDIATVETFWGRYLAMLRYSHQCGIAVILYIADQVHQLGGRLLTGLGDVNLCYPGFYCNIVDFCLDYFRPGQHPPGFFMATADMAAAYINAFDMNLDEQYNKVKLFSVSPRPKMNYVADLRTLSSKIEKISAIHATSVIDSAAHQWSSKQEVVNSFYG